MTTTFVVGATGYIGSRLSERLTADGSDIRGLAAHARIRGGDPPAGPTPVPATLADLDVLRREAAAADAVVWTVMSLNPEEYPGMGVALATLNEALAGSGKPLLVMGGGMMYADTGDGPVAEDGPVDLGNPIAGHALELEGIALEGAKHGVRSMGIRSSLVYGRGAGHVRPRADRGRQGMGRSPLCRRRIDEDVDRPPSTTCVAPHRSGAQGRTPPDDLQRRGPAAGHHQGPRGGDRARRRDRQDCAVPRVDQAYEVLGFHGQLMSPQHVAASVDRAHDLLGWTARQPVRPRRPHRPVRTSRADRSPRAGTGRRARVAC